MVVEHSISPTDTEHQCNAANNGLKYITVTVLSVENT